MAAIPLKSEYGPTLGRILAPRAKSLRPLARAILIATALVLVALVLGAFFALRPARYSHGGSLAFSFEYKGLNRVAAQPGEYVRIERSSGGHLTDSYAVRPIAMGPYTGSSSAELPLFASGYIRGLESRLAHFRLEGEGKTKISSTLTGYDVIYTAWSGGREVYGRDVMLLPGQPGARHGVVIQMLSTEPASAAKPVAGSGVLERPLKTFSFG